MNTRHACTLMSFSLFVWFSYRERESVKWSAVAKSGSAGISTTECEAYGVPPPLRPLKTGKSRATEIQTSDNTAYGTAQCASNQLDEDGYDVILNEPQ